MNVHMAMFDTMRLAQRHAARMPAEGPLSSKHIAVMWDRMCFDKFSYGKLCRYLGWAQCALVASGVATLEDVKEINKKYKGQDTALYG